MLQEGLEKAKALKLPISHEETLFSTPEDRRDMEGEAVMQAVKTMNQTSSTSHRQAFGRGELFFSSTGP